MLTPYVEWGLVDWLRLLKMPGRYPGMNGVSAMTNAVPRDRYRPDAVVTALRKAHEAGLAMDHAFHPQFEDAAHGLSYGLNPYTDWALSQLTTEPTHWYLFLGVDFYSISELGDGTDWFEYLADPFSDTEDRFWHRVWAWILGNYDASRNAWITPVDGEHAASFIQRDGGGFIFHNRIPYLRPAGYEKAGTSWPDQEWQKAGVRAHCIEDLAALRGTLGDRVMAFCTGKFSADALKAAGFSSNRIMNWSAHPSKVFYPSTFQQSQKWFRGTAHFQDQE